MRKTMEIVTISGSTRKESSNSKFLHHLDRLSSTLNFHFTDLPRELPLFQSQLDRNPLPEMVKEWRSTVSKADGLIICTPEYLHNIPAVIKNALEWITSSGEVAEKRVLAITLTPHAPRGDKAIQSLLWSLQALNANVVASLSLYQSEFSYTSDGFVEGEGLEYLKEALRLFQQ